MRPSTSESARADDRAVPSAAHADLATCEAMMRDGSKSFFAAAAILPRRVRRPAIALYAFCRMADDVVDACGAEPGAVAVLHERLARAYAGDPWPVACDRAFAETVAAHGIPHAVPAALLEGFAWDARGRSYETIEELHDYAARVAGTVGAMMARIMGAADAATLARACELGVAMQLTNIARDVGEDASNGRLYLPRAWMREAGIDPDAWLAAPRFTPQLAGVVARLLAEADVFYRRAEAGIAALPRDCRPAILGARLVYAEIGREVERRGLDSVTQRAVVPRSRKLALLARAVGGAAWAPRSAAAPEPLAAIRFLVEAMAPHARVSLARPRSFDERTARVVDLFERLAERDRRRAAEAAAAIQRVAEPRVNGHVGRHVASSL
jgi:phytoene synthase